MAKTSCTQKITNSCSFIWLLRVEPYMFVFAFSAILRQTPLAQLIQDKICIQQFNMSRNYCRDLAQMNKTDDKFGYKSSILGNAVQYNLYQSIITTCPALVISIFLGSFVDNFLNGSKILLLIGSVTSSIEALLYALNSIFFDLPVNYILYSFIPYSFSGLMVFNTCFAYIASTTPTKLKAIRLMILEVCILLSTNLGQASSGSLLMIQIFGPEKQLHNYTAIFLISFACNLFTILWTILFINERRDRFQFEMKFTKIIHRRNSENERKENEGKNKNLFKLLFNFGNIKEMVRTFTKKRENKIRCQLWLVNIALCLFYVGIFAPRVFQFQFMQKIYYWNAQKYGLFTSLTTVSQAITLLVVTPLLIKVFKLNDMTLAIIGYTGSFFQNAICGVLLSPLGFYISLVFGSTSRLGAIGYKTYLAKIVDVRELGKVNTFLSLIDALAPVIASLFSVLFKLTIDSFPGLCYLVLSALLLIPIYIAIWMDLYAKPLPDKKPNICYVTKL